VKTNKVDETQEERERERDGLPLVCYVNEGKIEKFKT